MVLVNAKHVKNVPGRKRDVLDCEWLRELHSVGLLRGSFRPVDSIVALRAYLRHRETLIQSAGAYIQRMQKALVQMNLQLPLVVSDITGVTGLRILMIATNYFCGPPPAIVCVVSFSSTLSVRHERRGEPVDGSSTRGLVGAPR